MVSPPDTSGAKEQAPKDGAMRSFAAVMLATGIFCLDAFTRADLAVASFYVLVLLLATLGRRGARSTVILTWGAACASLTLVGYGLFKWRGAPPTADVHLLISLTMLAVTTLLLLGGQNARVARVHGERRYRAVFDTLAVAIWEHDFTPVAEAVGRLRASGVSDLRRFLEENPAFVADMRRRVRITDVNATALTMMGVASRAAFFSHLGDFLPETDESFADCIIAIDERRPLFQAETVVVPQVGEPRRVIIAFGLGPDACLDRVPGSVLDVTERRGLEAQVAQTREEIARVERTSALAAMSASIAHELNQPMSAIHSYSDAARRWAARTPPDLGEVTAALSGLSDAVTHARGVMQRVRSLVGEERLDAAAVDLAKVVSSTAALMRAEADKSGARIHLVLPTDAPVWIRGDRILIKQMLVNLITNAVQAMEQIAAADRVVTLKLACDGGEAVLTISDRGPGWSKDADARVFGSFYTTKPHGMGLGLSISRATVERHGGEITLRNSDVGGAVVEVVLPVMASAAAAGERVLDGAGEEGRVKRLLQ